MVDVRARRALPVQRAGGEEVAPQPSSLVAHPVAQHDVLAYGETHEQLELLERAGEPESGPLRGRLPRDLLATEEHVSVVRVEQSGQHTEQRGLAGPVRPDEADDRARGHRDAHVVEGDEATEAHGDVVGLERGRGGGGGGGVGRLGRLGGGHDPATSAVVLPGCPGSVGEGSGDAGSGDAGVSSGCSRGSWRPANAVAAGTGRAPPRIALCNIFWKPIACWCTVPSGFLASAMAPRPKRRMGRSDHGASSFSTVWMNAGRR